MTTPSHVTVRGSVAELHISSHNMLKSKVHTFGSRISTPGSPPPHPEHSCL